MAKIQTFTAKMLRDGETTPKFIPNAAIWNGYIVAIRKAGRGKSWEEGGFTAGGDGDTWTVHERYEEIMQPYFDGAKVNPVAGLKDRLRTLETVQDVISAGLEQYLLRFGDQDGYRIWNSDEEAVEKQRAYEQEVADKKHPIPVTYGYFGLRIGEKIPPADWQKIKHLATWHKGDDDDIEFLDDQGHVGVKGYEVRGWYYKNEVVETLTTLGYTVQYHGQTVATAAELVAARQERDRQASVHYARVKEIKQQAAAFRRRITDAAQAEGPCSEQQAEHAATLPRVYVLDMKGPDIYGGGAWLHADNDDLYYVRNNGMDGDDWSRNNYHTGGAGAICYHLPGSAKILTEIREWSDSLGDYAIYTEA